MPDRRTIAVSGAALVAAVAIVVVVVAAVVPIPTFEDLPPGSTGAVAYEQPTPGGDRAIVVLHLGRLERVVADAPPGSQPLGWDTDGNLEVLDPMGSRVIVIDAANGERLATVPTDDPWRGRDTGIVWWSRSGGRLVLEREDGGTSSFPAPETYDVVSATALGDDRIVFVDELGRLAITTLGEDVTPRLAADDAAPWSQLVARP